MLNMEDLSRSVLYAVVSLSIFSFATGTVRFTKFPPPVVYANEGNTTTLVWEYYVSDKTTEFGLTSPKWEYYNETTSTWIEIANEALARSWNWTVSASCPPSLKPRLKKVSNATIQIIDVSLKDAGRYRCRLVLSTGSPISKETRLNVTKVSTTAPPTTVTTTPELPTKTSTPSSPKPTTPAPSKNYIVKLNGTINITKENEPSDVKWYIRNQTSAVFRSWSKFHNVTVEVYKQSSTRFIINLTLRLNTEVTKSELKIYVDILLDRIKNTSHFSSTITAIPTSTASPTTRTIDEVDDCTTGLIVGCVIGLIMAVVIVIVIAVVIYKRKKAKKEWTTLEKAIIGFGLFVAVVLIIVIIVLFLVNCS